jgi:hypothetical protein
MEKRAAQGGASIYVAGTLALTDPGPAAAGVYVADDRGRALAHRAYYLGYASAREASLRAVVAGQRLAEQAGVRPVRLVVDDSWLFELLRRPELEVTDEVLAELVGEARHSLGGMAIEVVAPIANPARSVALAPLVQWLPERTRRAENLTARALGGGEWEVSSEREPGQTYRVRLPAPERVGEGEPISCQCADFQYRGIPCKHLLAVAEAAGGRERLFYPEAAGGGGIPAGPREADGGRGRNE